MEEDERQEKGVGRRGRKGRRETEGGKEKEKKEFSRTEGYEPPD